MRFRFYARGEGRVCDRCGMVIRRVALCGRRGAAVRLHLRCGIRRLW